ncbi:hypothetical protein FMK49_06255 [Klebsiella michiganensis]|nr:hypothetical protein [Klebsiella michiganensis]
MKTQPATGETYPKSDLFNKATQPLKHITFKYDFLLGLNMCLSIVRQPIFTPTHELNKNHKLNERFNSLA